MFVLYALCVLSKGTQLYPGSLILSCLFHCNLSSNHYGFLLLQRNDKRTPSSNHGFALTCPMWRWTLDWYPNTPPIHQPQVWRKSANWCSKMGWLLTRRGNFLIFSFSIFGTDPAYAFLRTSLHVLDFEGEQLRRDLSWWPDRWSFSGMASDSSTNHCLSHSPVEAVATTPACCWFLIGRICCKMLQVTSNHIVSPIQRRRPSWLIIAASWTFSQTVG